MKNINFFKNLIILFSIVLITPFFGCGNVGKVEEAIEVDNTKNITEQDSKKRNDWEKHKLVGDVKKILEQSIDPTDDFKITSTKETLYSKNGYLIETQKSDDELNTKTIYSYDKNNVLLALTVLKEDNTILYKEKFKYDYSGNLIESAVYSDDDLISTTYVKNDMNGLPIEEKTVSDDYVRKSICEYDKDKNLIETTMFFDEVIELKLTYFYNEKGLHKKMNIVDSEGEKYTNEIKYVYDTKGNWVRYYIFRDGENIQINERTIEYY